MDAVLAVDVKTHIYGTKCISASRGTIFHVPIISLSQAEAQAALIQHGFTVYLSEPEDGVAYDQISYAEKCAVVVGSERFGINKSWFSCPHQNIYIPMSGRMSSLNVGVAASLVMYELRRKETQ